MVTTSINSADQQTYHHALKRGLSQTCRISSAIASGKHTPSSPPSHHSDHAPLPSPRYLFGLLVCVLFSFAYAVPSFCLRRPSRTIILTSVAKTHVHINPYTHTFQMHEDHLHRRRLSSTSSDPSSTSASDTSPTKGEDQEAVDHNTLSAATTLMKAGKSSVFARFYRLSCDCVIYDHCLNCYHDHVWPTLYSLWFMMRDGDFPLASCLSESAAHERALLPPSIPKNLLFHRNICRDDAEEGTTAVARDGSGALSRTAYHV